MASAVADNVRVPVLPRLVVVAGPPGAGKTTVAAALRERLGLPLIAEGNFRESWFDTLPPAEIVQVYVSAAPATLRERLLARDSHRHRVHYDREAADEIAERAASGEWSPLPIGGRVVAIDTTIWPDLDQVLRAV